MANATTMLVGQGSSHLFQNAAGFDIVGGQFVLGDVHNHAGPGPVPTSIPLDTSAEALSDSEIYYRQMLYQKRGFPLYVPGPKINLPAAYRRRGVAIGDVGRVTPEGVFDFFFNIFLTPDDPIHVNHTPEDFSPLALYDPIDLLHESYDPGDSVSSSTVQILDIEAPSNVFPGGQFVFRCDGPQGAVLALPDGADLQKLESLESMRAYAAEHADSWYKYINGARGRGISNGDLYLVTGCEKARSWGIASFRAAREEFRLSFKPTAIAAAAHTPYRWSGAHGQTNPSRRKFHDPPSTNDPVNQTTFIHGFSISLPTGLWGRLFGTVQTSSLVDFQTLLNAPGGSSASGRQDSLFSWSFNLLSGRGATGGKQHVGEHREAKLSDLSPTATVFNPAKLINEYILYKAPLATGVVMSHDDDWCCVLREDSDLSPSAFFRRLDERFTITEKDGATFLVPASISELLGSFQIDPVPALTALGGPASEIPSKVAPAMYDFSVSGDELAFRGGDMMIAADDILDGWWMDEAGAVSPSYTDVGPDTMQLPEDFSAFPLIGTSPSTSGTLPAAALPSSRAQRRRSHTASGKGSRLPTTVACNYCLARKIRCTGGHPCSGCARLTLPCTYVHDRNGRGNGGRSTKHDELENVSDVATIVHNILRDIDDGKEDSDATTLMTSVVDDDKTDLTVSCGRRARSGSRTSLPIVGTTGRRRPFLQDIFDLYASLIVSLELSTHKESFKTFPNSFSTDEAVQNLASLKHSQFNREPDPREPSRVITTTRTTTVSMTREMAMAASQHFMDARLIEDATDPSYNLLRDRGLYVLTPKGLHVLARFVGMNDINAEHLHVLTSQPICVELLHLERRLSDDEIIVTPSVVTALFRRFVGREPNYPNAPQDPFALHAERSRGVLLIDITDRGQPARRPLLHQYCFAAVAALEWLCDFTSVVGKEEAAEMATQFVRFGLITLVDGEDSATASMPTVGGSAPDGNSPFSPHAEFRCTPKAIYKITDEGNRVAHWAHQRRVGPQVTGARSVHEPSISPVHLFARSTVDEPDHENKRPTDNEIHRRISVAEKLNYVALKYILSDPPLHSLFREFLKGSFCEENLSFWLEVEDLKRKFSIASSALVATCAPSEPSRGATYGQGFTKMHHELLLDTAFLIYNKYLAPSSQYELNIDRGLCNELHKYFQVVVASMGGQGQKEQLHAFTTQLQTMIGLYERIQTHVFRLMATDSVPKLMKTPKFLAVRNWAEDFDPNADVDEGPHAGMAQAASLSELGPPVPLAVPGLKAAENQAQPEVLQNFFHRLLSSKDGAGTGVGAVVKTSETNGTGSGAEDAG